MRRPLIPQSPFRRWFLHISPYPFSHLSAILLLPHFMMQICKRSTYTHSKNVYKHVRTFLAVNLMPNLLL